MPLFAALVASLGIPLLLAAWARLRAYRRDAADRASSWFALAQQLAWAGVLGWLLWLGLGFDALSETFVPLRAASAAQVPLFALVLLAPPALLGAALHLLRHEASCRLRLVDRGWNVALREAAIQIGTWLVPIPLGLCALPAFAAGKRGLGVVLCLAALVTLVVLLVRRRAISGAAPHAVMSGEIRDRVFALAGRAGVGLRHLYVVPLASHRLANAFAVQGDTVMLTDYLIEQLDRDEIDAVLAHEMAHLQLGHPRQLGLALVISGGVTGAVVALGGTGLIPGVVLLLGAAGVMAFSRRIEFVADARALALGAKPQALITGLARLGLLNHIPAEWSRLREWTVTHPSTARRAAAIARHGGLPAGRASELLAHLPPGGERYAMPSALAQGREFTTSFKTASNLRIAWAVLAAMVAVPALFAALHGALALPVAARAAAFALSVAISFALSLRLPRWIMFPRLRGLERATAPGLALSLPPAARGRFLGLAPDAAPRIYESFTIWDVGLLALEPGRLDWSGEEARFTLAPSDVREITVVPGYPRWSRGAEVLVRWQRPDGLAGAFRLIPMPSNSGRDPGQPRDLAAWVQAWTRHANDASDAEFGAGSDEPGGPGSVRTGRASWLGAPPTAPVTSTSPRETIAPRALALPWIVLALLSAAACAALGLPLGIGERAGLVDVCWGALASHLLLLIPVFRYREPAAPSAASQSEPNRRAA